MSADGGKQANSQGSSIWTWLSVVCALAGCVLCALVVYSYLPDIQILIFSPVLFLFGLLFATIARARSGRQNAVARIGLWLNLGLLIIAGAFVVWLFFVIANGMPRG